MNHDRDVLVFEPEKHLEEMKAFLYANRKRANSVRLMDTDWPQSVAIRERLLEYVSFIPSKGKELAILSAIDRGAIMYEGSLGSKPDPRRLVQFLDVVLSDLSSELSGVRVKSASEKVWAPHLGAPLGPWLVENGQGTVLRVTAEKGEPHKIRGSLLKYLTHEIPPSARMYGRG